MNKIKSTLIILSVSCALMAQDKITPTIGMTWDYDVANDNGGDIMPDQRIGIRVTDKKRTYGFDTNGDDHRTILGYSFAQIGIGVTPGADDTNDTWLTLGASYNFFKGVNTELEFVHFPATEDENGAAIDAKSMVRLSLVLGF